MSSIENQSQQPPKYPPYQYQPRKRSRWWIPVVIIGAIIIGVIAVIVGFFATISSSFEKKAVTVKPRTVLYLSLAEPLSETSETNPLSLFTSEGKTASYIDALLAIRRAKTDDNIMGIFYKAGTLEAGWTKSIELREALVDFKQSGKFFYAFAETGSEKDYFFASAADSVFMPTEGLIELNGFGAAAMFFKGMLDKVGVDFYVQQFEEYKSAGESMSRKNFSKPAKDELRNLIVQRNQILIKAVAESRKLKEQDVRNALNRGVYTADTLLALGLIDAIHSEGAVKDMMKEKINATAHNEREKIEKLRLVDLGNYVNSASHGAPPKFNNDKQIAIVFASGTIVSGKAESGASTNRIVASEFIRNLRKARDNDKIKAIIIRIDSPGGSVIASDAIWEEIIKARQKKPIYASMSDVAASGGYYMAMACDTIIAHPATITGSIGVILALPNFTGMLDKLGISVDTVATSPSALFLNPTIPYSEQDKHKLFTLSENIYKRFVSRVAESRHKSFDDTRAIAKGRVWTGEEAMKIGLVDTLGGLQTAISIAKRRIGVSEDEKVRIRRYPEAEEPIEALLKMFHVGGGNDDESEQSVTLPLSITNKLQENIPLWNSLPFDAREQLTYLITLGTASAKEHTLMALPYLPSIK